VSQPTTNSAGLLPQLQPTVASSLNVTHHAACRYHFNRDKIMHYHCGPVHESGDAYSRIIDFDASMIELENVDRNMDPIRMLELQVRSEWVGGLGVDAIDSAKENRRGFGALQHSLTCSLLLQAREKCRLLLTEVVMSAVTPTVTITVRGHISLDSTL